MAENLDQDTTHKAWEKYLEQYLIYCAVRRTMIRAYLKESGRRNLNTAYPPQISNS